MQDFQNLLVWQKAHALSVRVYDVSRGFPSEERFGLTAQIRRAVSSIESNIAEGCGRGTDADFSRFLYYAMGSASESHCQLLLARDLEYLAPEVAGSVEGDLNEVKRMLNSLIGTINQP